MRTLKTLRPGHKGTKELVARASRSVPLVGGLRSRGGVRRRESLSASTGERPICTSGSSPPVAGGTRAAGSGFSAATTPNASVSFTGWRQ